MSRQTPLQTPPAGMPPPRERRHVTVWHWAIMALGAVVVVSVMLVAAGEGGTSTQPAAQQQAPPLTTAPPARPQPLAGAVLGGPIDDFTREFGSPTRTHGDGSQYQSISVNGTRAFLFVGTMTRGSTTTSRVDQIHVTPPRANSIRWTYAQAEAIAKVFLPPDAQHIKDLTLALHPSKVVEHVYVSARLAASFPADAFFDAWGTALVAPGTFHYRTGGPFDSAGGCMLQLGE